MIFHEYLQMKACFGGAGIDSKKPVLYDAAPAFGGRPPR
jgi:hypothetical protein